MKRHELAIVVGVLLTVACVAAVGVAMGSAAAAARRVVRGL